MHASVLSIAALAALLSLTSALRIDAANGTAAAVGPAPKVAAPEPKNATTTTITTLKRRSLSSTESSWIARHKASWSSTEKFPARSRPGYKPVSILGQGDYGVVYLAESTGAGKVEAGQRVAVKCSLEQQTEAKKSEFFNELYTLQLLEGVGFTSHTKLLDHFTGTDSHRQMRDVMIFRNQCLVLELVSGDMLSSSIESASSQEDVAAIMQHSMEVMRQLKFLARVGVSHKDLTADNVMVRDGKVVLIDFGLVGLREELCPRTPLEACERGVTFPDFRELAPSVMPLSRRKDKLLSEEYGVLFEQWMAAREGRRSAVEKIREMAGQKGTINYDHAIQLLAGLV